LVNVVAAGDAAEEQQRPSKRLRAAAAAAAAAAPATGRVGSSADITGAPSTLQQQNSTCVFDALGRKAKDQGCRQQQQQQGKQSDQSRECLQLPGCKQQTREEVKPQQPFPRQELTRQHHRDRSEKDQQQQHQQERLQKQLQQHQHQERSQKQQQQQQQAIDAAQDIEEGEVLKPAVASSSMGKSSQHKSSSRASDTGRSGDSSRGNRAAAPRSSSKGSGGASRLQPTQSSNGSRQQRTSDTAAADQSAKDAMVTPAAATAAAKAAAVGGIVGCKRKHTDTPAGGAAGAEQAEAGTAVCASATGVDPSKAKGGSKLQGLTQNTATAEDSKPSKKQAVAAPVNGVAAVTGSNKQQPEQKQSRDKHQSKDEYTMQQQQQQGGQRQRLEGAASKAAPSQSPQAAAGSSPAGAGGCSKAAKHNTASQQQSQGALTPAAAAVHKQEQRWLQKLARLLPLRSCPCSIALSELKARLPIPKCLIQHYGSVGAVVKCVHGIGWGRERDRVILGPEVHKALLKAAAAAEKEERAAVRVATERWLQELAQLLPLQLLPVSIFMGELRQELPIPACMVQHYGSASSCVRELPELIVHEQGGLFTVSLHPEAHKRLRTRALSGGSGFQRQQQMDAVGPATEAWLQDLAQLLPLQLPPASVTMGELRRELPIPACLVKHYGSACRCVKELPELFIADGREGVLIVSLHPEAHKRLRARAAAARVPAAAFGARGRGEIPMVARPSAYYVPPGRGVVYM
jgi:hypothetical protein